jgi:hypothetical protein
LLVQRLVVSYWFTPAWAGSAYLHHEEFLAFSASLKFFHQHVMDPFSITAGCVALTATATKLAQTITRFVRDVRAARGDLDAISREIGSLQLILLTLEDEFDSKGTAEAVDIPSTLRKQIHDMVGNCQAVLNDIGHVLEAQKSSRIGEATKWTLTGRADVHKLQVSLKAHRAALDIALELVNV